MVQRQVPRGLQGTAGGQCEGGSGLTLCLGHFREKLSSVNKQPVRRGGSHVRGVDVPKGAGHSTLLPPPSGSAAAEAGQTQDTSWHSHEPTLTSGGLEGGGAAGWVGGCRGSPCPCPRGRAHLCRQHTRSGRCGDTPSGSSPRWLPLAGSSSTSVTAPGNPERGRRDAERQRDPVRAQRSSNAPRRPQPRWHRDGAPTPLQPHAASPPGSTLPPEPAHRGRRRVPAICSHARGFHPPHHRPAAIPRGAGGEGTWPGPCHGGTEVFPSSSPIPSGCCRHESTRPRGVGRERAAAAGRPQTRYWGSCWRPPACPCQVDVPSLSPAQNPRVPLVVSPQHPPYYACSLCPVVLARGEEQGRAVLSPQLPFPCRPSLWHQATLRPFSSPAPPSLGCIGPAPAAPYDAGLGGGMRPTGLRILAGPAPLPPQNTMNTLLRLKRGGGLRCHRRRGRTDLAESPRGSRRLNTRPALPGRLVGADPINCHPGR